MMCPQEGEEQHHNTLEGPGRLGTLGSASKCWLWPFTLATRISVPSTAPGGALRVAGSRCPPVHTWLTVQQVVWGV